MATNWSIPIHGSRAVTRASGDKFLQERNQVTLPCVLCIKRAQTKSNTETLCMERYYAQVGYPHCLVAINTNHLDVLL